MNTVSINFRNSTITVNASNTERVKKLAERLNKRIDQIAANSNNATATDPKLAFMAGLMLEDELDSLKEEQKKQEKVHNSQQDVTTQVLSETLNQVATYLENLAQTIEK